MVVDTASQPTSRDEFEIAIVCTRALEYDAVCLLLDKFWDTDGDPFGRARGDLNTYTTGCMGRYNIVVVLLCNSGKATAAGAAASLRSSYPCIELLLLAGICEGVPNANGEEVLLGDVVISETVIQYDLGTQFVVAFKEKDTLEDRHGRANKNIRSFTSNIKTEIGYQRLEEKAAVYLEQIQRRASETKYQRRRKAATYMYPGSANDILFEPTHIHRHYNSSQCVCADYSPDEDLCAVCDESKHTDCEQTDCKLNPPKTRDRLHQKNLLENDGDLKTTQIPSIFFGRFGSGDTAFSSGIRRDSLARKHNIIAFEMEGAGVWDELPCIIVKGVSNYGDGHKTKHWAEWQNFAAATAASVARALVERYPQTDKSPATALKLQENKACLNALFITNPKDDKQRIEETKGGLLLDAYIWITRSKEFIQWLEDPETRLLWIKGDPGKGKTMLLCGIINELRATKPGGNVYYFLCQATDIRLNNASAVLRGLLHMIVVQQPSLISHIRDEYDKSGKSAFEGVNSWVVLSRIFGRMLRDDFLKGAIFIIDALDECVTDLAQLLEVIVQSSSSSSPLKWLVSSRNEADIQEVLTTSEHKSTVSLELNAESVSTAITIYIRHKVKLLSDKRDYAQSIRDGIEKYLSANANGTFLWVSLVCALLEKVPRFDPLPKSANFPPGLDQLYERMLTKVYAPSISDVGRRVLAIATLAYRPLTIQEFIPLIDTNYHHEDIIQPFEHDWEDILGHCGSFLTERNGTIYFVHQSAKDFLIKASQRLFPNGTQHIHREIFEASISIMKNILRKDMYNLIDPAFSIDDLPQHAAGDDPLIAIRYSCVYWIDHFEQSMPKCRADIQSHYKCHELIQGFLKEKYIYWQEALSLLRSMFDGIAGMQRLGQVIANSEIPGLVELAWDARRFIQMFGNAIADYPLQVYTSALIFSPTQSITRRHYEGEAPKWVQIWSNGESEWVPSARTYEGIRDIDNLAISCCGTWIASSHNAHTITIWETYSGKSIRVLDAHSGIPLTDSGNISEIISLTSVCFSPWDREELASSCFEFQSSSQLMIWDISTGRISQRLRIETTALSELSISYSHTTRDLLGYISKNHHDTMPIATILNTKTGQAMKRIQLQQWPMHETLSKFSLGHENKIACYPSYRKRYIGILNADNGSDIRLIRGEDASRIKFSPDGSLLAVFFRGRSTITLADTTSSETKWSSQTEASIWDFAFSPNGKLLAASAGDEIQLYSVTSGKCLRKIRMKSTYLVFSPDGSKIFCSWLSAIHVVEIGRESFTASDSGDASLDKAVIGRFSISLSPNGRLVASVLSHPVGIEVMDIDSKTCTHFLRNSYLNKHSRIHFSPDSEKLITVSRSTAILWNISSKPARIIFSQKSPLMFSFEVYRGNLAFSSDSECLAIALDDVAEIYPSKTIKVQVWDIGSGKRLMCLGKRGCRGWVHLCFSPDNRRLAISYVDEDYSINVEIWEISSISVIQAIDLNRRYLHGPLQPSNSGEDLLGSSDEKEQQNEEALGEVEEEVKMIQKLLGMAYHEKVLSFEEDLLTLDVKPSRYNRTGIRVALRTRVELELTGEASNMMRFKKEKTYDVNSERTWLEFNGKKLVWIPPQYRDGDMDSQQNCVALSHVGESYFVIQFRHSELIKQMSSTDTPVMGDMPCVPEMETYTYLREPNDKVLHRDMHTPDGKTLEKMDSVREIKYALSTVHRKDRQKYDNWKKRIFSSE